MQGQQRVICHNSNNFQLSKKKNMFSNTEVLPDFLKTKSTNGIPSKNQSEKLAIAKKKTCWDTAVHSFPYYFSWTDLH